MGNAYGIKGSNKMSDSKKIKTQGGSKELSREWYGKIYV